MYIRLNATDPRERYVMNVTSEATHTCRVYHVNRPGDRPLFMRNKGCVYIGICIFFVVDWGQWATTPPGS